MDFLQHREADEDPHAWPTPETCRHCRKLIEPDLLIRMPVQVLKATRLSPAEWEEVPLHVDCADTVNSQEYQDYCDEMESLRGYSDEERSRI